MKTSQLNLFDLQPVAVEVKPVVTLVKEPCINPTKIFNVDHAWRHFLIHSHLYYHLDSPVIQDSEYDQICNYLLTNFEILKTAEKICHPDLRANPIVDKGMFETGSGSFISEELYPTITKCSAQALLKGTMQLMKLDFIGQQKENEYAGIR